MNKFAQALSAALDRCIVTNTVAKQGEPVGFLYREAPVFENDSGWRFFKPTNTPTIPTISASSAFPKSPSPIPPSPR